MILKANRTKVPGGRYARSIRLKAKLDRIVGHELCGESGKCIEQV